jgi:hypothetical protein
MKGSTLDASQEPFPTLGIHRNSCKPEPGFTPQYGQAVTQVILGWWQGKVTWIGEDSFGVELLDLDGNESVAEIEISSVGSGSRNDVRVGARFVYSVWQEEGLGGAITASSLEFLPSHVWTEEDLPYIERRWNELYGNLKPD